MVYKCDRCHDERKTPMMAVRHHRKAKDIYLCPICMKFIRCRFDDVLDEYVLRSE